MIKITVTSYNNQPIAQPIVAIFDEAGGKIGRSEDNRLVLPDPKRYVSRVQASVQHDGKGFVITNLSQANLLLINGEELGPNAVVALHGNDEVQVGLYMLKVESAASASPPLESLRTHPDASLDPLAMLDGPVMSADPSATPFPYDPFASEPVAPASRADTVPSSPAASSAPFGFDDLLATPLHSHVVSEQQLSGIPEDFDPFALPSQAVRNSDDPLAQLTHDAIALESLQPGKPADVFADTPAFSTEPLLDNRSFPDNLDPLALFSSKPLIDSQLLPVADISLAGMPAPGADQPDPALAFTGSLAAPDDLLSLFSGGVQAGGSDPVFDPPMQDQAPQVHAHFEAPMVHGGLMPPAAHAKWPPFPGVAPENPAISKLAETATPPLAPASSPAFPSRPVPQSGQAAFSNATAEGGVQAQLLDAFLRGSGLPGDCGIKAMTPELMEVIGSVLRAATSGTVDLMSSRTLIKREVQAGVTVISPKNNNPLKFMPDGQSAMTQMFGRKIPGFMPPKEAMQDAYQDLRAHQVGVIAGMRAALDGVLQRFDPARLEQRMQHRSLLDTLFGASREAKMWALYQQLFREIYDEAQDDFQTLFGKAFVAAYESEVAKFDKAPDDGRQDV